METGDPDICVVDVATLAREVVCILPAGAL
jgi:hypothetical protein